MWCRIGEIADIGTGGTPLTSTTEYYNGNIPWITSSATGSLFVSDAEKFITVKAVKETNCKVRLKEQGNKTLLNHTIEIRPT